MAEARRDGGTIEVGGEVLRDAGHGARLLPDPHRRHRPAARPTACSATSCSCRSWWSARSTRSTRRWPLANDTPYGLTAGIFSRDDDEIRRFLDTIQAGVVYVNRRAGATTGAWPGIQTFGGWKGSGSSGKSGLGPYYVQQFLREQSQTVMGEPPAA